jgi:ketosteroid isomerase-like protein
VKGNRFRSATLERAVRASIVGDSSVIDDLYTVDVRGWLPRGEITSSAELACEFELTGEAFSNVDVAVWPLDVNGPRACVEWEATAVHSGTIDAGQDVHVAPTGKQVRLRGVTVAEFDDDRICSFRQYWDELTLLVELGILPESPEEAD